MMFREKSISKYYTFALAAVFALTLAGCGGNGGTAMETPEMPEMPETPETPKTPEQIAEEAVAAERKRVADEAAAAIALEEEAAAAEAARVAANKMFETKATAIVNEGDDMDNTGAFDDALAPYTLKISHKDGAASVEVTDPAMLAKNDPQFEMMDGKYVRDNGNGVAEIVGIHTDIEAAKNMAFGKVYDLTEGDATPDMTTSTPTTYVVAGGADGEHGKVASDEFPSQPDSERDFAVDDNDTATAHDGTFPGTFDGAEGTFECVAIGEGETCTIMTDAKGKISALGADNWEFTPDAGETVSVTDKDYMHYGFWIMKTVKDDVTTYNQVQTFAGSSLPDNMNISTVVAGNAKYEGGAAGVYVYNTVKPDSSIDNRSAGTFTADVALTAYFGTEPSVAMDKHDSVHGTVSNFDLSGGEANKWEVELSTAGDVLGSAEITGAAAGMEGDSSAWNGTFYGDGAGDAPPPVLVGEFDANFANGSAAGGFGTRYKK